MTALVFQVLIVFSVTLVLTKSKILGGKREFINLRYLESKAGGNKPSWVHRIWHAFWTCPMCSGYWMAIVVCATSNIKLWLCRTLAVAGLNWLLHCAEAYFFFAAKNMETLDQQRLAAKEKT